MSAVKTKPRPPLRTRAVRTLKCVGLALAFVACNAGPMAEGPRDAGPTSDSGTPTDVSGKNGRPKPPEPARTAESLETEPYSIDPPTFSPMDDYSVEEGEATKKGDPRLRPETDVTRRDAGSEE